jgi:hypothetical protein
MNGVWEWVYLGPVPDSAYFQIEAKASGASSAPIDIDVLVFLPHDDHQVEAPLIVDLAELTLGEAHDWTFGSDRYGHRYASRALSSAPTVPVAGVRISAPPLLHPGEVQPIVFVEGSYGTAIVTDLAFTLAATVTPRYRYRGGT